MKRIVSCLLLLVMVTALLASCGETKTTKVNVHFVTWENLESKNQVVLYETALEIKTADPTLFTVMSELTELNPDIKPVYGEKDADGNITAPTQYFDKTVKIDDTVKPSVMYQWYTYHVSGGAAANEKSPELEDSDWGTYKIVDGEDIYFVYAWWEMKSEESQ